MLKLLMLTITLDLKVRDACVGPRTHGYLVKLPKLQCAVAVDGRPDVLAVVAVLHQLQLTHTAHVGQPRLDLRHV